MTPGTKMALIIEGGLINEVIANGPVEILTIDHDIQGGDSGVYQRNPAGRADDRQMLRSTGECHGGSAKARKVVESCERGMPAREKSVADHRQ